MTQQNNNVDVSPNMFTYVSKEEYIAQTNITTQDLNTAQTAIQKDTTGAVGNSTATIQGDLGTQTTTINNNTTSQVSSSTSTTATNISNSTSSVNSNTNTQTGVVNSNVNTLKATDASTAVTISAGTTYQTVYSRSGQGSILLVSISFAGSGYQYGIRLTIDGQVYAIDSASGVSSAVTKSTRLAAMSVATNPYYFETDSTTGTSALVILDITYKTSVLIEAYCNGTTRQVKYHNRNYV